MDGRPRHLRDRSIGSFDPVANRVAVSADIGRNPRGRRVCVAALERIHVPRHELQSAIEEFPQTPVQALDHGHRPDCVQGPQLQIHAAHPYGHGPGLMRGLRRAGVALLVSGFMEGERPEPPGR